MASAYQEFGYFAQIGGRPEPPLTIAAEQDPNAIFFKAISEADHLKIQSKQEPI